MHEKQAGVFGEQMTVKRSYFNAVLSKGGDDGIDLVGGENEIAGAGNFVRAGFLKVDGLGDTLRACERRSIFNNGLDARNAETENTAGPAALSPESVLDGLDERGRLGRRSRRGGFFERGLRFRERRAERLGDLWRVSMSHVMHVEDVRSFIYEVVVNGGDFKTRGPEFADHGIHFVFQEDEVSHDNSASVVTAEGRPGAEREPRFDVRLIHAYVKVGSRKGNSIHIAGFLARPAQGFIDFCRVQILGRKKGWRPKYD